MYRWISLRQALAGGRWRRSMQPLQRCPAPGSGLITAADSHSASSACLLRRCERSSRSFPAMYAWSNLEFRQHWRRSTSCAPGSSICRRRSWRQAWGRLLPCSSQRRTPSLSLPSKPPAGSAALRIRSRVFAKICAHAAYTARRLIPCGGCCTPPSGVCRLWHTWRLSWRQV